MTETVICVLAAWVVVLTVRSRYAAALAPPFHWPKYQDSEAGRRALSAASRLFDPDDRGYLKSRSCYRPGIERRLRALRRRAMFLYLQQMRREFHSILDEAQSLAAQSHDQAFGMEIVRATFRMRLIYMLMWTEAWLSIVWFVPVRHGRLVESWRRAAETLRAGVPSQEAVPATSLARR